VAHLEAELLATTEAKKKAEAELQVTTRILSCLACTQVHQIPLYCMLVLVQSVQLNQYN
jgi:hypothetical protein